MLNLFEKALAHQQAGEIEAAIQCYFQLLEVTESADIYANLAVALRMQGKMETAIALYRKALQFDPRLASALSNLGGALRTIGHLDEALLVLKQAIEIAPDLAASHFNLGLTLMDMGQPEEALSSFEQAKVLEPKRTDAPLEKARALLKAGCLLEGFKEYELRLSSISHLQRDFKQPQWDGTPLQGKTLLLYSEQGFGDSIQFIRYVSQIEKEEGRIILECPPELKRLMQNVPELDEIITTGECYPHFDVQVSLFSLPYLFKTRLETIPNQVPYLSVSAEPTPLKTPPYIKLKIGIVWASGFQNFGLHNRSIGLKPFLSLLELPGCAFYSLQKGPAAKELKQLGCEGLIQDMGSKLGDFADTAAVLQELDLFISADTAVVHLAGALGKPIWTVLPFVSEWRWLVNRDDSPWYPTMRLFHQTEPGNWEPLFQQMREQLGLTLSASNQSHINKT